MTHKAPLFAAVLFSVFASSPAQANTCAFEGNAGDYVGCIYTSTLDLWDEVNLLWDALPTETDFETWLLSGARDLPAGTTVGGLPISYQPPQFASATTDADYWDFACDGGWHPVPGMSIEITVDQVSVLDVASSALVQNLTPYGATYTQMTVDGVLVGLKWGGYRNGVDSTLHWGQAFNTGQLQIDAGTHLIEVLAFCDEAAEGTIGTGDLRVGAFPQ